MRPHDGRIDHQILVLAVAHDLVKHLLPDAAISPPNEAFMYAFILSVALRKVAPSRSGPKHPQHSVDEHTVVSGGPSNALQPSRKQILDLLPLHIAQLVPANPHTYRKAKPTRLAKCICRYALVDDFKLFALFRGPLWLPGERIAVVRTAGFESTTASRRNAQFATCGDVKCTQTDSGVEVTLSCNPDAVDTIVIRKLASPATEINPIPTSQTTRTADISVGTVCMQPPFSGYDFRSVAGASSPE